MSVSGVTVKLKVKFKIQVTNMKLLPLVCLCLMARSETMFADEQAGAAPKPYVITLRQTKDWALLQCEVRGAFPKPTVEWQDSAGNKFPGEEPQVSERGGSFYITLQTTVMKTDRYRCVATQEEIKHQIYAETHVYIHGSPTGWIVAVVVLSLAVVVAVLYVRRIRRKLQRERTKTEIALLQSNGIKDNASGQEDHDSHFPDKV